MLSIALEKEVQAELLKYYSSCVLGDLRTPLTSSEFSWAAAVTWQSL